MHQSDLLRPSENRGHDGDEKGDERGEHEDCLALGGTPHRAGEFAIHVQAQLETVTAVLHNSLQI